MLNDLSTPLSASPPVADDPLRISFVLPGLHRVHRGAEVAFESIATEISKSGQDQVSVVGSGQARSDRPYTFEQLRFLPREHFERAPKIPPMRSDYVYEEAVFAASYLMKYRPSLIDVTVTSSYPFVNWMLTRWPPFRRRPAHVFVTQNGDWPVLAESREYRLFRCDALVCTNPDYYERNRESWPSVLIPNGVDVSRFYPGVSDRAALDLPADRPVVLMVSALIESKRVLEGMRACGEVLDAMVVVAGDGPLRSEVDALAAEILPGRFRRLTVTSDEMPALYRAADVVLHPTLFESFGNVYVEALATGLPVVVNDYSVTRWIFGDQPGLVDASDHGALVDALRAALTAPTSDPATLASRAAERFAWPVVAAQYRAFLAEVVRRKRETQR